MLLSANCALAYTHLCKHIHDLKEESFKMRLLLTSLTLEFHNIVEYYENEEDSNIL